MSILDILDFSIINTINTSIILLLFFIPLVFKTRSELFMTTMIISYILCSFLLSMFVRKNNLLLIPLIIISIIISIYFTTLHIVLYYIENDKNITEEERTYRIEKIVGNVSSIISVIVMLIYIIFFYISIKNQSTRPRSNAVIST